MTHLNYKVPFLGTYQYGARFPSENPLEEVWSYIKLHGNKSFLEKAYKFNKKDQNLIYASSRFQQSVEFWESARNGSLITAPLNLYYSFLNLTRSFLFIVKEVTPTPTHGLKFKEGKNIFNCSAKINKKGTFTDTLTTNPHKNQLTLLEILQEIPELYLDFIKTHTYTPNTRKIHFCGYKNSKLEAKIDKLESKLTWNEIPFLNENFLAKSTDNSQYEIALESNQIFTDKKAISNFLADNLQNNLTYIIDDNFWTISWTKNTNNLPRLNNYLLGMFILGSVVRYNPESLINEFKKNSTTCWLLNKFIEKAQRYFPQLVIQELHNTQVYFN